MIVAFGCDHGGFPLRNAVLDAIRSAGHEVIDFGLKEEVSADYPDFAELVGKAIQQGNAERGILLCGSGIGISIAACKMNSIYASVSHDTYSAHQGVEHDGMNVLCMGARIIGVEVAKEIVVAFLSASVQDEERHCRRRGKVKVLEENSRK